MSGLPCGGRALAGDASAPLKAFVRADAAVCECELQDRELCAGERLRLAGFSSGTGVGTRGGLAAQRCSSVAALSVRFMSAAAFLLERFVLVSRLLFAACAPNRTACDRLHFYSVRVGIALVRSRMVRGYRAYWVYFRFVRFFMAITTGNDRSRVYDKERRVGWAFLLIWLWFALRYDTAGRTLGLKCGSRTAAAPDCAKESKVEAALPPLWTLFF